MTQNDGSEVIHMTLTATTQVYSAAAWWRNCEPFACMASTNKQLLEDRIKACMDEELALAVEQDIESADNPDDVDADAVRDNIASDLCWSGVNMSTIATLSLTDAEIAELESDGIVSYGN